MPPTPTSLSLSPPPQPSLSLSLSLFLCLLLVQQKGGKEVDVSSVKSNFLSFLALGRVLTCQKAPDEF